MVIEESRGLQFRGPAAVDVDDLAVDEIRGLGGEEDAGSNQFLGESPAAGRGARVADPAVERQRQAAPEYGPCDRLAERRGMGTAVKNQQVQCQQYAGQRKEADPQPRGHGQIGCRGTLGDK